MLVDQSVQRTNKNSKLEDAGQVQELGKHVLHCLCQGLESSREGQV